MAFDTMLTVFALDTGVFTEIHWSDENGHLAHQGHHVCLLSPKLMTEVSGAGPCIVGVGDFTTGVPRYRISLRWTCHYMCALGDGRMASIDSGMQRQVIRLWNLPGPENILSWFPVKATIAVPVGSTSTQIGAVGVSTGCAAARTVGGRAAAARRPRASQGGRERPGGAWPGGRSGRGGGR